jgi:DNA topoisomerase IB
MEPLLQADLTGPGTRRRRCGRGFRYFAADGAPLADARALARIKALVIPPAWEDVGICPSPRGHVQAVGTDDAGRRQYLYHELWRQSRDREKFDRVMEFGRSLPRIRAMAERHLNGPGLSRERVLAAAVRLIGLGFFRPGGRSTRPGTARTAWRRSAVSTWHALRRAQLRVRRQERQAPRAGRRRRGGLRRRAEPQAAPVRGL